MTEEKRPRCADCALRRKAEAKPRSFVGILWKLHTYICPGWKAYKRRLAEGGSPGSPA
jgi:hypothetical protein